jgi:transitional endoplasmic reticulum ATPase
MALNEQKRNILCPLTHGRSVCLKFSEGNLRQLCEDAQSKLPGIIFIDGLDSITPNREKTSGEAQSGIVSQLLTVMDRINGRSNIVMITATDRPNGINSTH